MAIPLTVADKENLLNEEPAAGLTYVCTQHLKMDSHGCNVVLVVCEDAAGVPHGFTCRYSSEAWEFEDDPMEAVQLSVKEIVAEEYVRADGQGWEI
jgi:hypothetical protein